MMFQRGVFAYTAIQDIGAYILELPYGSGQKSGNRNSGTGNSDPNSDVFEDRVSMIVVLPKKGQQLYETIDNVNKYGMERLFKELRKVKEEYEDDEVEVHLPRFETTTSLNLVEALQNVNHSSIFNFNVFLNQPTFRWALMIFLSNPPLTCRKLIPITLYRRFCTRLRFELMRKEQKRLPSQPRSSKIKQHRQSLPQIGLSSISLSIKQQDSFSSQVLIKSPSPFKVSISG